jgi:hypothetical protein
LQAGFAAGYLLGLSENFCPNSIVIHQVTKLRKSGERASRKRIRNYHEIIDSELKRENYRNGNNQLLRLRN